MPAAARPPLTPPQPYRKFAIVATAPGQASITPRPLTELQAIPAIEQAAIGHAVEKLECLGLNLGYPHSSNIRTADNLRELRPRGGRSWWRVFYARVGEAFVVGAIGPVNSVSQRDFKRAVTVAERRIKDVEGE
ncbi:type II toxin-antitoxin system RelE/ParE family toxin [Micromonospora sp. NPDC005413]|uniref:type II toxin-antitoxin system RelE/ParE family toxin n=1 Tax=Micromonospora sp. NPDC005413 TaxID=3154563 RepID=UPI0033BBA6BE